MRASTQRPVLVCSACSVCLSRCFVMVRRAKHLRINSATAAARSAAPTAIIDCTGSHHKLERLLCTQSSSAAAC